MTAITPLLYLIAASLFIIGLKRLNSPATARQGNAISGMGMLLAIVVTLFDRAILSYTVIIAGLVVGSAIGWWMARTVKMTAMPQMVALLNGFGGGASLFVAAPNCCEPCRWGNTSRSPRASRRSSRS
jgi:NAD(P) transhydrogenase subunit beta